MRLLIAERSPILRKRLTRLFSELEYVALVAFVEELAEVHAMALEIKPAFKNAGANMVFNKKDDLNSFIGHLKIINDVEIKTPIV